MKGVLEDARLRAFRGGPISIDENTWVYGNGSSLEIIRRPLSPNVIHIKIPRKILNKLFKKVKP